MQSKAQQSHAKPIEAQQNDATQNIVLLNTGNKDSGVAQVERWRREKDTSCAMFVQSMLLHVVIHYEIVDWAERPFRVSMVRVIQENPKQKKRYTTR